MAKNKEGVNGLIQKLAMISDEISQVYTNSKSVVVFSLNDEDFFNTRTQVNDFTTNDQFKIDISGIEFIFLRDVLLNNAEDKI
jgi:hypothetical protein